MKLYISIIFTLFTSYCAAQTVPDPEGYEARENLRELGSLDGAGSLRKVDKLNLKRRITDNISFCERLVQDVTGKIKKNEDASKGASSFLIKLNRPSQPDQPQLSCR